jgi:hypothetical protein
MIWVCFPRDNTVLFYYNILRLSSLFTLRRSILTAVMLGLPLSTSLVLSLREIGFTDVRQILGGLLFVPITMFDRFWGIIIRSIYDVRQILVL